MHQHCFNKRTIDELIEFMTGNYEISDLRRVCREVHIPKATLSETVASSVMNILAYCVDEGKVEEVVTFIARDNANGFW